jgi:hypothetical protein
MAFGAGLGFVYGLALAILAALAAGAGHGTYVLMQISSAPVGLVGAPAAMVGAPVLWAVVGALSGMRGAWRLAVAMLIAHYAGAIWLTRVEFSSDSNVFLQVLNSGPVLVFMWVLIYIGGQYAMWLTFIRGSDTPREADVLSD